jgi:riboflavin synthase
MFTGIIEELGRLTHCRTESEYDTLRITARLVLDDLKEGHSIAVNGVCLTVVEAVEDHFTANVIHETLDKTTLGMLKPGDDVNLERSMEIGDRFHGHLVQGHVETVGIVRKLSTHETDVRMTVALEDHAIRYCVPKGSIALDGVSLTIAEMTGSEVSVALIPYTLSHTILGRKQVGEPVNVETDILARFMARFEKNEKADKQHDLDWDQLRNWGFGEL